MTVQEIYQHLLENETITEVIGLAAGLLAASQEYQGGPSEVRLFLERVVQLVNEVE